MAIYHFAVQVVSRANGSSAVASAAYRAAERLPDERLGRDHDFSNKAGVIHSEVMLPEGAPERLSDRAVLWNTIEAGEKRKDAQLARDVEFSIPRELSREQGVALAREFVAKEFVGRGMVADLNVHWDFAKDGTPKPHAHVMLAMRSVGPEGFGAKVREWNARDLLQGWREAWATHVNERLAELGIDARIDHRTLAAQGIDLEPQNKIGPAGARRELRGEHAERVEDHARIARDNGAKILADPAIALEAITRGQATFTRRDLAMFVHRHSDGKEQFDAVMATVQRSPELVALGRDGKGNERFTAREMVDVEARLEAASAGLAGARRHGVDDRHRRDALALSEGRGLSLSFEQRAAFDHVTGDRGLASVVGYAGSGKSAMLGVAREAWAAQGYQVRGAALSGIAAENLEGGSGIAARTIASMEHQWSQGRDLLTARDVLVIDEAGMIGTRQMERVLSAAASAGAKVVMVGDPEQLQAIEAGAAFRSLTERHGAVEITGIRRQHDEWQREATKAFATGRTAEAIRSYGEHGMVQTAETREAARDALIDGWERGRVADPGKSRIILTHTNAEVRDLNELARARVRDAGGLGDDVPVSAERGSRMFATSDRLMFLKNERSLGVKNGTLGTIEEVRPTRMVVRLDSGQTVRFDLKDYAQIDHGYAATIHKSQGVTVDQAHVLATPGLDRHGAYVALTRHRERVELHYGRDYFADERALVRTLSRERAKDMAGDYAIDRDAASAAREVAEPAKAKGMFARFRPKAAVEHTVERVAVASPTPQLSPSAVAVQRYACGVADIERMTSQGLPVLPHQEAALARAGEALDKLRPDAATDLAVALQRDPRLVGEAVAGRTGDAIRAANHEMRVRTDPQLRADRFADDWRAAQADHAARTRAGDVAGVARADRRIAALRDGLARDPQVESLIRARVKAPGVTIPERERSAELDRVFAQTRQRDRGHDMGR